MTVYVSETKPCKFRRFREYAYLLADTVDELQEFADRIGLDRAWFQGPPKHLRPHYDLFGSMIHKAKQAGATPIKIRDFVRGRRIIGEVQP